MKKLSTQLQSVIRVKNLSKMGRLLNNPIKYLYALYTRFVLYPITKKGKITTAKTFFGDSIHLLLPAGTDIYLTGGKSHNSELRLSSFIIDRLEEGNLFVDVGAHFGFFSLLASKIVGDAGRVIAYEGGQHTYEVLNKNVKLKSNIQSINKVVSNTQGEISFYQFPSAYSEYNSLDVEQYKNTAWIKDNPPKVTHMQSVRLSSSLKDLNANIIKIDVEGAEMEVLKGLEEYLESNDPIIVIEYLSSARNNKSHISASKFLKEKKYKSYIIISDGSIEYCSNIEKYMNSANIDSDNIVFIRED